MSKTRKTSIRTCIGCGESTDKLSLIRVVRTPDSHVVIDATGKSNGRGAYIHSELECFELAIQKRRFGPALRTNLKEDDLDRLKREFDSVLNDENASRIGMVTR